MVLLYFYKLELIKQFSCSDKNHEREEGNHGGYI